MYPQKCPFLLGDPGPYLKCGSLGLPESTPKWHLNQFIRFSAAHGHDQQTHTQMVHATSVTTVTVAYMLCIAIRPKNGSRDPDHTPFRDGFSSIGWDLLWPAYVPV